MKSVVCLVKNRGKVKNREEILIYNHQHFPLFFTGRKLRLPGIGIEATVHA